MPRVAIIGGGPAGYMAAINAADAATGAARPSVTVFDAAVPLAKLLRTGGGRCNLANATLDNRELAAQYPRGGKFLLSAFARFGAREAMDWFISRGCALKEEEGGRVFPRSDRAEEVRDLLAAEARRLNVQVHARAAVTRIERPGQGFRLLWARGTAQMPSNAVAAAFDRIVIATGGDWKDRQGSGYELARSLGHSTTPLAPSLAALRTAESWPGSLAGLAIRGARLVAHYGGKKVAEEIGDLLFTHRGISGPVAFRISSRCAFLPCSRGTPVRLQVSALPDLGAADIEASLIDTCAQSPRQQLVSAVRQLVPRSLAEAILSLAGVDALLPCSQLSREKRKRIAALLDRLPLTVVGTEKGDEMVTAGGIVLTEVDPRTMGSRLVPGLFFCGEVLDIDGFTGGFNLLAAWSTGRCAGLAAMA
jgi:predicted Rossmann fold flavoprotein